MEGSLIAVFLVRHVIVFYREDTQLSNEALTRKIQGPGLNMDTKSKAVHRTKTPYTSRSHPKIGSETCIGEIKILS